MDSENPYAAPSATAPHPELPAQPFVTASQGKRFANLLVDYVATTAVSFAAGIVMGLAMGASASESDLTVAGYVVGLGSTFAYYFLMEGAMGRTLGKLVTGTKVVDAHGNRPTWGAAALRTLCRFIPFEPFSFLSKAARGWHDSLTKTWVISSR
jgi:uncharacterized RDD family membrane protein YckC